MHYVDVYVKTVELLPRNLLFHHASSSVCLFLSISPHKLKLV